MFKICIAMAGAVSAGAYTAGVMDYLTEALSLWQAKKKRISPFRQGGQMTTSKTPNMMPLFLCMKSK